MGLSVETDAGYTFTGWTGACSGTLTTCNLTLNGDKTVGATFEKNVVTLTIDSVYRRHDQCLPGWPVSLRRRGGPEVETDAGYTFTGWTGACSGTLTTCNLTLNGDKTVGATYEKNLVTLTIDQSTGGTISAFPAGPYTTATWWS